MQPLASLLRSRTASSGEVCGYGRSSPALGWQANAAVPPFKLTQTAIDAITFDAYLRLLAMLHV